MSNTKYSKQFRVNVSLDEDTHSQLKRLAKEDFRTLNSTVEKIIKTYLKREIR